MARAIQTIRDLLESLPEAPSNATITKFEDDHIRPQHISLLDDAQLRAYGLKTGDILWLKEHLNEPRDAVPTVKRRSPDDILRQLKEARSTRLETKVKPIAKTKKVEIGWRHFDGKKFVTVSADKGGGKRKLSMDVDSTYSHVYETATRLYFPGGANNICHLSDCESALGRYTDAGSPLHTVQVEGKRRPFTLQGYQEMTCCDKVRLYLHTKPRTAAPDVCESPEDDLPEINIAKKVPLQHGSSRPSTAYFVATESDEGSADDFARPVQEKHVRRKAIKNISSSTDSSEKDTSPTVSFVQPANSSRKQIARAVLIDESADTEHYSPETPNTKGGACSEDTHTQSTTDLENMKSYIANALKDVVGLAALKSTLTHFGKMCIVNRIRHERGLDSPLDQKRPVMVFLGNPGTGKTAMASVVSGVMAKTGLTLSPALVVAQREDLVGAHIGETAIKTKAVIDRARGGTLLIDECYRLSPADSPRDFGIEAIETIMASLEGTEDTSSDRPALIFAGYTKEVDSFIKSNPGLKRRITEKLFFPDYTPAEILQVMTAMASNQKLNLTVDLMAVEEEIKSSIPQEYLSQHNAGFSGRMLTEAKRLLDEELFAMVEIGAVPDND